MVEGFYTNLHGIIDVYISKARHTRAPCQREQALPNRRRRKPTRCRGCWFVRAAHRQLAWSHSTALARGEEHTTANWYATVRATELAEVENLASNLREQGGQHLFAALASSMAVNSVMEIGNAATSASPIVRVHSNCLTGDIFGSMRCECGPQLDAAIDRIARDPEGGYLVYMAGTRGSWHWFVGESGDLPASGCRREHLSGQPLAGFARRLTRLQ